MFTHVHAYDPHNKDGHFQLEMIDIPIGNY